MHCELECGASRGVEHPPKHKKRPHDICSSPTGMEARANKSSFSAQCQMPASVSASLALVALVCMQTCSRPNACQSHNEVSARHLLARGRTKSTAQTSFQGQGAERSIEIVPSLRVAGMDVTMQTQHDLPKAQDTESHRRHGTPRPKEEDSSLRALRPLPHHHRCRARPLRADDRAPAPACHPCPTRRPLPHTQATARTPAPCAAPGRRCPSARRGGSSSLLRGCLRDRPQGAASTPEHITCSLSGRETKSKPQGSRHQW